jgi:hypothetical protein
MLLKYINSSPLKYLIVSILFFFNSCKEESNIMKNKSFQLGDQSTIVTEKDSTFLQNFTEDISLTGNSNSNKDIAKMMVQIDSLKVQKKLSEELATSKFNESFKIKFSDCEIIFDNLMANELSPQQPEKNQSVSYVVSEGELKELRFIVKGLKEVTVQQRVYTVLQIENDGAIFTLSSLGKKISDWYNLAGKDSLMVSVGRNSIQFKDQHQSALRNAAEKSMLAKRKNQTYIQSVLQKMNNTKNYTDAPCVLKIVTAQYKIKGKLNGKSVSKLIQLDIPIQ